MPSSTSSTFSDSSSQRRDGNNSREWWRTYNIDITSHTGHEPLTPLPPAPKKVLVFHSTVKRTPLPPSPWEGRGEIWVTETTTTTVTTVIESRAVYKAKTGLSCIPLLGFSDQWRRQPHHDAGLSHQLDPTIAPSISGYQSISTICSSSTYQYRNVSGITNATIKTVSAIAETTKRTTSSNSSSNFKKRTNPTTLGTNSRCSTPLPPPPPRRGLRQHPPFSTTHQNHSGHLKHPLPDSRSRRPACTTVTTPHKYLLSHRPSHLLSHRPSHLPSQHHHYHHHHRRRRRRHDYQPNGKRCPCLSQSHARHTAARKVREGDDYICVTGEERNRANADRPRWMGHTIASLARRRSCPVPRVGVVMR